ncbi:hypothetical protein D3C72_1523920 [compost metagenome]
MVSIILGSLSVTYSGKKINSGNLMTLVSGSVITMRISASITKRIKKLLILLVSSLPVLYRDWVRLKDCKPLRMWRELQPLERLALLCALLPIFSLLVWSLTSNEMLVSLLLAVLLSALLILMQ